MSAKKVVSSERVGDVAVLTIDNPPVNALSHALRSGLAEGLAAAIPDPAVKAIVIICAGRTFVAGADITEFGKPMQEPSLHSVIDTMEGSPKPVVAAIHGTALGGGLELALAAHYRVAVKDAKCGLPEVKLGLLPGAGGTQRLPRVVGVPLALDMITGGDPIDAKKALETGLVDEIVDDLRSGAIAFAERAVRDKLPLKRVRDRDDKVKNVDPAIFAKYRENLAKRRRGFLAPVRCLETVEAAATLPFEQGLAKERELFLELMASDQSKAQRYFFFAEREAAKIPDVPVGTPVKEIRKAAVLGAGTMGGGIAMNFANVGIPVTIVEQSKEALDRGLGIVRRNYEISASRGGLAKDDIENRMSLIKG
jgi:3-hydroxyacyl-CoA dehydrogenase